MSGMPPDDFELPEPATSDEAKVRCKSMLLALYGGTRPSREVMEVSIGFLLGALMTSLYEEAGEVYAMQVYDRIKEVAGRFLEDRVQQMPPRMVH